jgi:hypothetical protein
MVAAVYTVTAMSPILYFVIFKLIIPLDPLQFKQYAVYVAWTILIQISCAPFIYYTRSGEYRNAFRRTLCGNSEQIGKVGLPVKKTLNSLEHRVRKSSVIASANSVPLVEISVPNNIPVDKF